MAKTTETSFDAEKPEVKPAYVRMIDGLGALLNPQERHEKLLEHIDAHLVAERQIAIDTNKARIEYEDGLKEKIAGQRESIVAIDAKLRFYVKFIDEADNSSEFKRGFQSALTEIRRCVERCPENDDAE